MVHFYMRRCRSLPRKVQKQRRVTEEDPRRFEAVRSEPQIVACLPETLAPIGNPRTSGAHRQIVCIAPELALNLRSGCMRTRLVIHAPTSGAQARTRAVLCRRFRSRRRAGG